MTGSPSPSAPLRIWIDTDLALGAPRGDVDDGFALAAVPFCLNFRRDPAAARAFFALGFRRRLVFALDVVGLLRFDGGDLERMAAAGCFGRCLAHHSRRWLSRAPLRYLRASFPVWDLAAALDAVGILPGVVLTPEGGRVASFDVAGAREAFFDLLNRSDKARS